MRKLNVMVLLLVVFPLSHLRAEEVVNSTAALTASPVITSTTTADNKVIPPQPQPSVGITGETISTPLPEAMTNPPGKGVFTTLTRTPYQIDELPTSAEVVKPEKLEKFDAQNAGEFLNRETGVQSLPIGAPGGLSSVSAVSIRGATSAQTLVLIDGRPMEGFALGTPDLSEIPTEQIDHIEIVRGGASALYGPNAIGGVVNVITKRSQYNGLPISHVGYESGSYGRQIYTLDVGSRSGPFDYYFFGDQKWISGFRDNTDDRQYNIGGNVGLSMGKAGKFLFDASGYHNEAGIPGPSCGPNDQLCLIGQPVPPNAFNNKDEKLASSPTARQIVDDQYLRTSYLLPLPADSLLTVRAFGMQREVAYNDSEDPNPFNISDTDRHEQSRGTEAQVSLPYGLLVGGSFLHDREDNTDLITPSNTFIKSAENWGIFGQDTFQRGFLTLIPSGRFDHNSQAGDFSNPRVQGIADANEWLRFSASAGHSFRAPTIDELYLVNPFFTGNPNLQPERAWTYDAGFEVHVDSYSFQTTYYRATVSDLIQSLPVDPSNILSPYVPLNVGTARRQGAEIEIKHVVNEYFRDEWNYTYLENLGIPSGYTTYVPLAFSPRHTVNFIATVTPTKKWTFDVTARYEDSRNSGNDQTGTELGSELLVGFRVAYQWRQMELYLGGNDINNKRYEEQPGYPLPGVNFFGGIKLRLWG